VIYLKQKRRDNILEDNNNMSLFSYKGLSRLEKGYFYELYNWNLLDRNNIRYVSNPDDFDVWKSYTNSGFDATVRVDRVEYKLILKPIYRSWFMRDWLSRTANIFVTNNKWNIPYVCRKMLKDRGLKLFNDLEFIWYVLHKNGNKYNLNELLDIISINNITENLELEKIEERNRILDQLGKLMNDGGEYMKMNIDKWLEGKKSIPLKNLTPNQYNFNIMDNEKLESLIFDIVTRDRKGLRPLKDQIEVIPLPKNNFMILDGHKRILALQRLDVKEIPLDWLQITEYKNHIDMLDDIYSKNIKGKKSPLELARYFKHYMETTGWNQSMVASRFNMSESHMSEILSILKLPRHIQLELEVAELKHVDTNITRKVRTCELKHLILLAAIKDKGLLEETWERMKKEDISVKQLKELIRKKEKKLNEIRNLYENILDDKVRERAIERIEPIILDSSMNIKLANDIISQEMGVYLPTPPIVRAFYPIAQKLNKFKEAFPDSCEYKEWEEGTKLHFMFHVTIDRLDLDKLLREKESE